VELARAEGHAAAISRVSTQPRKHEGHEEDLFLFRPDEKTVYVANEFSYRFDKVVLE
jgi:hypothetical protein